MKTLTYHTKATDGTAVTITAPVLRGNYDIEKLELAFQKYQNKKDWRLPFTVIVPDADLVMLLKAIDFYLADTPKVEPMKAYGNTPVWKVTTKGYQAW